MLFVTSIILLSEVLVDILAALLWKHVNNLRKKNRKEANNVENSYRKVEAKLKALFEIILGV